MNTRRWTDAVLSENCVIGLSIVVYRSAAGVHYQWISY